MQRPIKCRAKKIDWNEFTRWDNWLYANGYYSDGINYWFTIPNKANSAIAWVKQILIDIKTLGEYTGLKDKNGVEACHFDIANGKYLLYLDLVYGLYLTDISNGAIIRYKEGIIDEITGNYFEQHEKISADCQRSIDKLISQASRTM